MFVGFGVSKSGAGIYSAHPSPQVETPKPRGRPHMGCGFSLFLLALCCFHFVFISIKCCSMSFRFWTIFASFWYLWLLSGVHFGTFGSFFGPLCSSGGPLGPSGGLKVEIWGHWESMLVDLGSLVGGCRSHLGPFLVHLSSMLHLFWSMLGPFGPHLDL